MSNETQESRNSGDNRRRRSRGGSNRNNHSNNNERRNQNGTGGDRDSRNHNPRGQSQGHRQDSNRAEEFRPQAPRSPRTYTPVKLTFWQKILKVVGLYKEPTPPARGERIERKPESGKRSEDARPPRSDTRNARSNEGQTREPREKRPEGDRQSGQERSRNDHRKSRGGDPKTVESTRVYVGNLSYDVSEQDLQELFKGIGGVRNVEIVYNRSTHRSKGYGFVEMLRMDEAVRAVEVLHDQHFMGRKMTVSGAKSKGQDDREDNDGQPEREPRPVVLASTAPAIASVPEEVTVETAPSGSSEISEVAKATALALEARYGMASEKPEAV
jgi:RNA recognition motif. (a.k.a. RRM, RBD, or RNP domain)